MAVYSIYRLATFSGKRVFYIEDILWKKPKEAAVSVECFLIR